MTDEELIEFFNKSVRLAMDEALQNWSSSKDVSSYAAKRVTSLLFAVVTDNTERLRIIEMLEAAHQGDR